jgi:hypothetical protein
MRAALVVAAMAAMGVNVALAADAAQPWVEELNRLSGFIGRTLSADEVAALEALSRAQPEVSAMRAALLYRADPVRYRADFAANFTVDDYASRARGETTELTQEQFRAQLKEINAMYPTLQGPVQMLVHFVRRRNANQWFALAGQRLSVARFFRSAVLVSVFEGSTLDTVTVADGLDRAAYEKYEKGK